MISAPRVSPLGAAAGRSGRRVTPRHGAGAREIGDRSTVHWEHAGRPEGGR